MAEVDLKALFATTKEKISNTLYSGLPDRIPLLNEIRESGNLETVEDGGRSFSEPSLTGDSLAVGAYVGTDTLDVSQQGGIDKFQYTPAFIYGSVFMAGTELAMNAGDQAAVKLLDARIQQMKESKYNELDAYLCGANNTIPTGRTKNQGNWLGLQDIVSDTNTSTIFGTGIDRSLAVNAKTRNQVVSTSIASATAWNTSNAGRQAMTDLYLASSFGNDRPNLCLMTRTIFSAYNISLQANERFVDIQKKAGGGYPHLVFMVDCKVSYGDNVLAGHFYMINTKYMKFKVLKNKNFKMSDFLDAYQQDLQRALCTTGGQLTTGAPKFNGVYTGGGF